MVLSIHLMQSYFKIEYVSKCCNLIKMLGIATLQFLSNQSKRNDIPVIDVLNQIADCM